MAIINKTDLKNLSNSTYVDNTVGAIRPQDVRHFNDELIDSLVDETDYVIDSGSWNSSITNLQGQVVNILSNTGSFVTNDQTASMSVGTASYVDLRGDGIVVNYANGWIELTGSAATGNASVIVSDTAPTASLYPSGTLWFNSINTSMYVNYWDGVGYNWIGIGASGPVISASYSITSSYANTVGFYFTSSVTSASLAQSASWVKTAQTASYFITASVTSASRAELAGEALWYYTASVSNATYAVSSSWAGRINVTGSGIGVNWYFDELQLTGSAPEVTGYLTTQSFNQWTGSNTSLFAGTSSLATRSITANTASYINVTGSGIFVNWNGSQLQLTGSKDSQVIVSDTPPVGVEEGQQWFNSITTNMYVYYGGAWVGISASGPVVSSSYSVTASHSITASSALYAQSGGNQGLQSVTTFGNTTSQSIDISDRLIVNITGSGTLTQGESVEARGNFSHAQGYDTVANGDWSHAEGNGAQANGLASHAEGFNSTANGEYAHSEGDGSIADGFGSHAEGYRAWAVGQRSHAEGSFTLAEGDYSHAEGESTHAIGRSSNASGLGTVAQGIASNTEGRYTNAGNDYQSVVGQWNIPLTSTEYQSWFIIGDGNGASGHPKELHNLFMAGDGRIIISGTLDISGSILGISGSSAPQIPYIAGPGIVINGYEISSSVLTVNGVAPDINGNIATALTNVITGTSGSLIISSSGDATGSITEGTVWVVSGMSGSASASNGVSYIWDGKEPGEWLKLSSLDIVTADQRYVIQSPSTLFLGTASLATRALTASFYNELDTLQSVTTRGNVTSQSVIIDNSLTNGQSCISVGPFSHAEGFGSTAIGQWSHAEGIRSFAGTWAHSEGYEAKAYGNSSHAEGDVTTANGARSHAEGYYTIANGGWAHTEGISTVANGQGSHAEGFETIANFTYSHAEGWRTYTNNFSAHAEGDRTTALGNASHAEGTHSTAIGNTSHAEGGYITGASSIFKGGTSIGQGSHAEGHNTTSVGIVSHAEGHSTTANGFASHAEGIGTIAGGQYSHASGRYNIPINEDGVVIIGDGDSDAARKNLFTAGNGKVTITGSLFVNGTQITGGSADAVLNSADTYPSVAKVLQIVSLTLTEYNNIVTKDANVLYIVKS